MSFQIVVMIFKQESFYDLNVTCGTVSHMDYNILAFTPPKASRPHTSRRLRRLCSRAVGVRPSAPSPPR